MGPSPDRLPPASARLVRRAVRALCAGVLISAGLARAQAPAPAVPSPTFGRTVNLPPFVVAGVDEGAPWTHARASDFEVLSRCDDDITMDFIQEIYQARQAIDALVPVDQQVQLSVPTAYILYDQRTKVTVPSEILASMEKFKTNLNTEPNMMLHDGDAVSTIMLLQPYETSLGWAGAPMRGPAIDGGSSSLPKLFLTPYYVLYLLASRVPAPPAWFLDGFMALYEQTEFTSGSIKIERPDPVPPFEIQALTGGPKGHPPVPPIEEFFPEEPLTETQPLSPFPHLGRIRADLFIRWALTSDRGTHREAFWRFVSRVSADPPATAAMFQECFGLSYPEMLDRLSAALPDLLSHPLVLYMSRPPALPPVELRGATPAEVGRIKGDWERLEVHYIKEEFPPLTQQYLDEARKTLRIASAQTPDDPGLLAVMGLDESDNDDDAGARSLLEAAVRRGVVRPRVYFQLARIRLAEALARPAEAGGQLSATQAAYVLAPILSARAQAPALAEDFLLIAQVGLRSAAGPTPEQLELLNEGPRDFPLNFDVLYAVAVVDGVRGDPAAAAALAERAWRIAPEGPIKTRFSRLKAALPLAPGR